MLVCTNVDTSPSVAAAAAAESVTSITRCSCDVGCPCCGRCVQSQSSSSSWSPLPDSSIAALRDVDNFIAMYRVSSPPPLISSPSTPGFHCTTSVLPVSTAQLDPPFPAWNSGQTLLQDYRELTQLPAKVECRTLVDSCNTSQPRTEESMDSGDGCCNSSGIGSASDASQHGLINRSETDVRDYHVPPLLSASPAEQPAWYQMTSQSSSQSPAPSVSNIDSWHVDRQCLDDQRTLVASDSSGVDCVSTNTSKAGFLSTNHAPHSSSTETVRESLDPENSNPPRSSVLSLAQQLDVFWAQRREIAADVSSQPMVIQREQVVAGRVTTRPTAPPPAPPAGFPVSTNSNVDQPGPAYDEQWTTQTLPRAASTRSLQAPPPRPPPRSTTHDSNSTSAVLGRRLPPEPSPIIDTPSTFDRDYPYQGQVSTFQGQRALSESGGHGRLSGSVQSLPGCGVTSGVSTSRVRPAPQPPRRGSSMSPRLQTKSTRYGGRARSTSLRSNDDDVDADVLLRLTSGSSSTSGQQLDTSETSSAVRDTARKATVSGQKPVAQIRPHAIRSPSASSYTRERMADDDDRKCSVAARQPVDQPSSVTTDTTEIYSDAKSATLGNVSSSRQATTSVSRFETLRSRIKDYMTAAAGPVAGRKQQMTSSSSFADWTLPRGRRPGPARRSSSATSWEPHRSDYASSATGSEASFATRGSGSFDDGAASSSSLYFGVFSGPRPFSSSRTRATEVSLPQNIVASADSSTSAADVTSSITSRISTFLTFLGGSRRPASPTSDTTSTTTPQPTASVMSSGRTDRPSNAISDAKTPAQKAVIDPVISSLERRSRSVSASPPVRSASTSEVLAKAAAAAAAAATARDARGRQPLRFVREQRTSMSTFRSSGSLSLTSARFSNCPSATEQPAADGFQISDGRRTSKSGTLDNSAGLVLSPASAQVPSVAHQSAPSTPLDWSEGDGTTRQAMTCSLPDDNQTTSDVDNPVQFESAHDVSKSRSCGSTTPLSVFRQVDVEVERLIELLQNAVVPDDRPPPRQDDDGRAAQVEAARESLLALTRQFVDDSQRLVSGATRSVDALVAGVEPSLTTLARLTDECRSTAAILASPSQGVMLVGRVRDLAQAYRSTVSAARSAVGRPFNSVEMKSLMRQATSLAAILSSLIKMLNRTDNIC